MSEPDGLFTGGDGRVPAARLLYLAFLCLLFFAGGFGLGYLAG